MSRQSLNDIAESLLRSARENGATAADVVVAEGDSLGVTVRLGQVEKVQRARAKHLGLRAFVDDRSAITSTADFSRDALAKLGADSVALARVTAPDSFSGLPSGEDVASVINDLQLHDPGIRDVTAEQATEWCKEGEAAAMEADDRIDNSDGAEFDGGDSQIVYAASNGFHASYRSSSCSLSVIPIASQNGSMQRDYWYSAKRHLGEMDPPSEIGRQAATRTVRRLGARQVPTGEVPVVFDPEMAASLMRPLAGAVSGNALYRRTSFLLDQLGEQIAPSFVTVQDDGTLTRGLGSKPFDGEGVATRRTTVIENGVLASHLLDSYSARKLDGKTTGNASRSVADAPQASPTNFFLQPGETTPDEIIRSVQSGLYVTELMGFGVNAVTGDYSRGASGLWIENGELAYPVEEITIAGNLLQMFRDIEMIGNDLDMRHSISAPTLKLAKLTVAGQ